MRLTQPRKRAALVLLFVACSMWLALRTARATLTMQVLDWSANLLDLPATWQTGAPRELMLNGARMGIVSGHSELALRALLDRLQTSCRARSRLLEARPVSKTARLPGLLDGVLRLESERAGVVACLELGSEPLGLAELTRRLEQLAQTGDLNRLGPVRMARVEARERGSFFVVAASDGALPLPLMFPDTGDAPGLDLPSAPRPPDARRVLSVWQLGREPRINVYDTSRALDQVWPDYLRSLATRGFSTLSDSYSAGVRAALLDRQGHSLLVVGTAQRGGASLVLSALDGAGDLTQPRTRSADSPHVMRQAR
jgi:hypothetical protein